MIRERLLSGDYIAEPPLTKFELDLLLTLAESQEAISNKELAQRFDASRNQISKARASISRKIDILTPGF